MGVPGEVNMTYFNVPPYLAPDVAEGDGIEVVVVTTGLAVVVAGTVVGAVVADVVETAPVVVTAGWLEVGLVDEVVPPLQPVITSAQTSRTASGISTFFILFSLLFCI
jgi:hypothetical protein